jgi:hypothetical protein
MRSDGGQKVKILRFHKFHVHEILGTKLNFSNSREFHVKELSCLVIHFHRQRSAGLTWIYHEISVVVVSQAHHPSL